MNPLKITVVRSMSIYYLRFMFALRTQQIDEDNSNKLV